MLVFIIYNLSFIIPVDAHVLKTDGSIGAVLHIDPQDDPIAGEQSSFFFEFKDTQNKFQPQNCNCVFSIEENGAQIYSQPLFQNNPSPSLNNASVFYTLPERGVYQLKVAGTPTVPNGFQPFSLTYDIRVDKQKAATGQSAPPAQAVGGNLTYLIGAGILAVFLLGVFSKNHFTKKGGE